MVGTDHVEYLYGKAMPLIFAGSEPRSGTMLTRAMLEAHPELRCRGDPHHPPRAGHAQAWSKSGREKLLLDEVGVTGECWMPAFILEVIAKHGEPARPL
ncbi:hypothetical protein EI555_008152 [Monodon monoceros]|uniref:Protein-tyrosine sulfotransferase n=1 Tax=Monodon monoceros TaxID=40151 RepID=A0A4U1ET52_MONMO|nr:hypothetical protein EI555_008152 [Monodon monoceros]